MIDWWKERKQLKYAREVLRGSQKWLRMHRDLLSSGQILDISTTMHALEAAVKTRYVKEALAQADELEQKIGKAFPAEGPSVLRENVEVLLVAVLVAMAVRSFFFQPFKIPTGSMQPTLYGIHADPDCNPMTSFPKKMLELLTLGKSYGVEGCQMHGDHIFVDRFTYHFRKPNRGEVIVFETADIPDIPASSRGKFYIKRLIGLGGDTIQVDPPYVKVNGEIMRGPAFERMYSMENGYHGYTIPDTFPSPKYINSRQSVYQVPGKRMYVMGDNSRSSLDGRFWGSLPDHALVGRAVLVYWPFSKRFGLIN